MTYLSVWQSSSLRASFAILLLGGVSSLSVVIAPPAHAVDPVTTAATIKAGLEIAKGVSDLFGSDKESDDEEILSQLAVLEEQNKKILKQLSFITDVLANLDVIVQTVVAKELVAKERDSLAADLKFVLETRRAEVARTGRISKAAALRRYAFAQADIATTLRQFSEDPQVYGFGYFELIGQGMVIENFVSRRLDEGKAIRISAGSHYKDYFEKILDPGLNGSIGQRLKYNLEQRDRLSAVLGTADVRINRGFQEVTHEVTRRQPCGRGESLKTVSITRRAIGSAQQGYKIVTSRSKERWDHSNCRVEPGGPQIGGPGGAAFLRAESVPDPASPSKATVSAMVNYWNAVRNVRDNAVLAIGQLEALAETAKVYRAEATRIATSG